jgi:NACalpha-BTF3-like transcription factor
MARLSLCLELPQRNATSDFDPELAQAWIDEVVGATGCSEDKARELLDACDWDIVAAIAAH